MLPYFVSALQREFQSLTSSHFFNARRDFGFAQFEGSLRIQRNWETWGTCGQKWCLTQYSRRHAEALVLRDVVRLVLRVDGVVVSQFEHLLEGVVDEDEADEAWEALLSEAGEVLDQEAGVGGHKDQAEERRPQADPQAELQVV